MELTMRQSTKVQIMNQQRTRRRYSAQRIAKRWLTAGRVTPRRMGRLGKKGMCVGVFCLISIQLMPPGLLASPPPPPDPNWQLHGHGYQALTPALRKKVEAREQAASRRPDRQPLTARQMEGLVGRGYRNQYFDGTLPWQRNLRDVNLCNGNLFKSFTDIQVSPARGAGLALQRTYNSNDSRIGPFGEGWTHAYDIRMTEEGGGSNLSDRTDFFGGKHKYHRDADGLYTPPVYLFDGLNSDYNNQLLSGPPAVLDDTDTGLDGTTKHYVQNGNERDCDWIQDRYGNRTNLTYGQPATMPDGSTRNLLTQVTDPSGRSLNFTWTNLGSQSQPAWRITLVAGPQYSVRYDYYGASDPNAGGSPYELKDVVLDPGAAPHLNRQTTYTYTTSSGPGGTEAGLLVSISDPLGETVSYQYSCGSTDQYGNFTAWPTGTAWVTGVTEPAGNNQTVNWTIGPEYANGNLIALVSNNGGLSFQVGSDSQLRCIYTSFGSVPTFSISYDSSNNVLSCTRGNANGYTLPPGSPYLVTNPEQWFENVTDNYTYGPIGNVLTHTVSGFTPTETTTYYDATKYFQKASFTDMNGHVTNWDYFTASDPNAGNRGQVKWVRDARYGTTGKEFDYTYNQYGQKESETNENGVLTQYTYGDSWGNLTQVVQDVGGLNRTTAMQYDVAGHVLQSTDPANLTSTFSYNNLGQPLTASFPAANSQPAELVSYGYGGNGRTESVSDNRGTTTIGYLSGCDRVSTVTDPVTGATGYTYLIGGERATMALAGGGTWSYSYPWTGVQGATASNEIETKDDPNSFTLPMTEIQDDQGRKVDYGYGMHGEVGQVIYNKTFNGGGSLVSYCEADYFPEGWQSSNPSHGWIHEVENRYAQQVNGVWTPTVLSDNQYGFDNAGNRLTNQITDNTGATRTETYGYDELNRLTSVNYGDGETQGYSFDPMGNRLTKTDNQTGNESYTFNNANMLLSDNSNTYTNDLDGNTLSGGGRTSGWDSQNRMASCVDGSNTSTYVYGADGYRHQSTVNGVTTDFVLDGQFVTRERRSGINYATYFIGAKGPMYRRDDTSGSVRWYLFDGLGSVLGEIDPSGNVTDFNKYDVYGSLRSRSGSATTNHGFVGQLGHTSEAETGLIYMRARYMDPVVGRFISEDPKHDGANWFAYCDGDPVNAVDQNGKDALLLVALILGIIGFVFGFLESVCSDYMDGNPINWVKAVQHGAFGAAVGLFGGLVVAAAASLAGLLFLTEALSVTFIALAVLAIIGEVVGAFDLGDGQAPASPVAGGGDDESGGQGASPGRPMD